MRSLLPIFFLLLACHLQSQNSDDWEVVYLNDFSKKDPEWFTTEAMNNISRIAPENSRLVLELFDHGTKRAIDYTDIDFNKDFILKAEIGSKGDAKLNKKERSDFGLYFGYSAHRYHQSQSMYAFLLNFYEKGVHLFAQNEDGSKAFKTIVKNVNYNPRAYTNIGVKKEGNTMTFYLNGELILTEKAVKTAGGAMTFLAFRKMKAFMRKLTVYHKPEDIDRLKFELPTADYQDELSEILSKIKFQPNSSILRASSEEHVASLAEHLAKVESARIQIEVHTDDHGDPDGLQMISQDRADLLRNMLIEKGLNQGNLTAQGFGDLFPVTDDFSEKGQKMNERIEIKFSSIALQEVQPAEQN